MRAAQQAPIQKDGTRPRTVERVFHPSLRLEIQLRQCALSQDEVHLANLRGPVLVRLELLEADYQRVLGARTLAVRAMERVGT
jgi:hypothetical protein